MAQHDYNLANQSGLAFRQDLNNALAAIVSQNSGASEPSTPYAYQWWADTTTGLLKQRNAANNAWITIGTLASVNLGLLPAATAASTYAPLTGTGASGTWPINISGNAATATTATTAATLSGTGPLSATEYSYTADFPSVRPSLLLDFANSKALDPRISYSRASTATYVGADGLIKTAAINEPRFDHNPTTGESLGLLIEEARTNLALYSGDFSNAAWVEQGTTKTANALAAPDGTTTAALVVPTAASATHKFRQNVSTTDSSLTFSVYLKAAGYTRIALNEQSQTGSSSAIINLADGSGATSGTTVSNAGNGWYRVSWSSTFGSGSPKGFCVVVLPTGGSGENPNNFTWTANGTSGIYIWGAQLEAGAFPTAYIPTTAATVTRSADVAQMTGASFSSWFNSGRGTFYVDASRSRGLAADIASSTYNQTHNHGFSLGAGSSRVLTPTFSFLSNSTISAGVFMYNGGGTDIGPGISNLIVPSDNTEILAFYVDPANQLYAMATANRLGTLTTNSGRSGDTSYTSAASMIVGYNGNFYGDYNGTIARIAFYPARITNAQLQSIASV